MTKDNFEVAIIGAGPSGLALAKELLSKNIKFRVFERNSNIGGLWDINNSGSPLYDSAHFISSKTMSGFSDYPMPDDYPDYPSHELILKYLKSYATHFNLNEHISLNSSVEKVEFNDGKWMVRVSGEEHSFEALVCASGVNWIPNKIDIPGEFSKEIIHSVDYKNPEILKDKNVLVIGAGNSACDIACDAASVAKKTFISMRRGYHFLPKHIFGMPADVYDAKNAWIPLKIKEIIFPKILRLMLGDLTKYNLLKPNHKIFESHPILNSQLIHYLQHGDIEVRRDLEGSTSSSVIFSDNVSEEIDIIIQATGYKSLIPYLGAEYMDYKGDRPDLYLNIFSRKWDNLMATGFMETNSGAFRTFELMAKMISTKLTLKDDKKFKSLIQNDKPDLSGGINYIKSERHANYINKDAYKKYILKLLGELK